MRRLSVTSPMRGVTFIDELVKRSGVKDIDYVLVNLNVDFLGEVNHPGVVDVS